MELSKTVTDIRVNWAIADAKRDEGLVTPDEIKRYDDISYGPHGVENLLDIYVQKSVTGLQPTIINVHGGGWVYGSKEVYQYYCMSLAMRGFTVVNINYRLAPESRFPAAVEDINNALLFIEQHCKEYSIDKSKLIMVGDSAGGQLVSHYATVFTNPEFAKLFKFEVPKTMSLKAVGLNCGAYDGKTMALNRGDEVFLEYIGAIESEASEELLEKIDTLKYMTSDFPAAFVMSSEMDFLLPAAKPMYDKIVELGVPAKIKIYGSKDRPDIGHVFHINCKLPEADACNEDECEFFKKYI